VVSVGPYRLTTRTPPPRRSFRSRTSDPLRASPARLTVRIDGGRLPWRTSSVIADGTVLRSVTSPPAASLGSAMAFSARTTLPPAARVKKISKAEMSKQIEVAASTPAASSAL
jgi:hypothetical protein